MSAQNMDRLKRLLLEGFGQGDMSVLDEVVAEDFIEHQQGLPHGREGLKDVIRDLRQAFPDLSYTVVQMVEDGDKVWGHFRARGTNEGPFIGQQPTGKVMEIDVIDISRFDEGKMVQHWGVPDRLGTLLQLGFFPCPADGRLARRTLYTRTSENQIKAKFAETLFYALG